MIDGRLTIGITKFDRHYTRSSIKKKGAVTVRTLKDRVAEAMKQAVDMHMTLSDDMIIPLSGDWALASSRLASCLIDDPKKEIKARKKEAAEILCNHPDFSPPCGQGQNPLEAMMKHYPPFQIVKEIESISGISELKAR